MFVHAISFLDPLLLFCDDPFDRKIVVSTEPFVLWGRNLPCVPFVSDKMGLHGVGQYGRTGRMFTEPKFIPRARSGNSVAGDDGPRTCQGNSVLWVYISRTPFTPGVPACFPNPAILTVLAYVVESDGKDLGASWTLVDSRILWRQSSLLATRHDRLFLGKQQPSFALGVPFTKHPRAGTRLDNMVGPRMNRNF